MMIKIKYDGATLYINEGRPITLPYDLWSFLVVEDIVIVLLKIESGLEDNVLAIDKSGTQLWRIESLAHFLKGNPYGFTKCEYSGIYYNELNDELTAYNACGFLSTIDLKTGRIINTAFIK